jgi:hypothetical protein
VQALWRLGSLAKRVRDDLEAKAFLDKEAFQQIRRPDGPSMRDRKPKVRDAGFEGVHKASYRAVVLAAIVGDNAGRKLGRDDLGA